MGSGDMESINLVTALLWLGGAILFARANRPEEPHQLRRVPLAALSFVAGTAAIFIVMAAVAGGLGEAIPYVIGGAGIIGVAAFCSALVVDLIASAASAKRTPQWLAAGIGTAIAMTYAWLSMLGRALWGEGPSLFQLIVSPMFLAPALVAAATGVVWWSELPRPDDDGGGSG